MGCASSKQARQDQLHSPSPYARSASMPVHRHAQRKVSGEGHHHVVALTSSTLCSLKLDDEFPEPCSSDEEMMKASNDCRNDESKDQLTVRAKAWSQMMERRIPKTPSRTPPGEPETINAWELMAGLEDAASPPHALPAIVERSFSFHTVRDTMPALEQRQKSRFADGNTSFSPKPMWMQFNEGDSIVSDFDPEIISTFRKALEELSPQHPFLQRSPEPEKIMSNERNQRSEASNDRDIAKFTGIVKARISAFQEKIDAKKALNNVAITAAKVVPSYKCPPGGEEKVVFYFTSLRGVRKTYEDCWAVRVILKGYSVRVDERDVSMHGGYKEELNEILGQGYVGSRLPWVFANGKYLGGAAELQQMHDAGELGNALEGCEMAAVAKGGAIVPCEGCGDMRFIPCETCSGSCKVFVEEEDDEGEGEVVGGFQRCPDCNENGLVRCPLCCSA